MAKTKQRSALRFSIPSILLGAGALLVVVFLLSYHVVYAWGDTKVVLVFPKENKTFKRTFVDFSGWGLSDAWEHRGLLPKMGKAYFGVLRLILSGKTVGTEDRRLLAGHMEDNQMSCTWGEHHMLCFKP